MTFNLFINEMDFNKRWNNVSTSSYKELKSRNVHAEYNQIRNGMDTDLIWKMIIRSTSNKTPDAIVLSQELDSSQQLKHSATIKIPRLVRK